VAKRDLRAERFRRRRRCIYKCRGKERVFRGRRLGRTRHECLQLNFGRTCRGPYKTPCRHLDDKLERCRSIINRRLQMYAPTYWCATAACISRNRAITRDYETGKSCRYFLPLPLHCHPKMLKVLIWPLICCICSATNNNKTRDSIQ